MVYDNLEHAGKTKDTGDENINTSYEAISLVAKKLPVDVFNNMSLRNLFEDKFRDFGECSFLYLSSFKKCVVSYTTCENALIAQAELDGKTVLDDLVLSVDFKERYKKLGGDYLLVPKTQKLFLLSPPASPPVGWKQKEEPIPVVNYDLLSAVASMQKPGMPVELISKTDNAPSIVVVGCEKPEPREGQKQMKSMKNLPRKEVQTRRPPITGNIS